MNEYVENEMKIAHTQMLDYIDKKLDEGMPPSILAGVISLCLSGMCVRCNLQKNEFLDSMKRSYDEAKRLYEEAEQENNEWNSTSDKSE